MFRSDWSETRLWGFLCLLFGSLEIVMALLQYQFVFEFFGFVLISLGLLLWYHHPQHYYYEDESLPKSSDQK